MPATAPSKASHELGMPVRTPPGAWLSLVNVVCCVREVFCSGLSLVHRIPAHCGMSEYDREASIMRRC